MTDPSDMVESYGKRIMQLEQRLIETELSRDSWKREAEMNQEAADKAADYAARLAAIEKLLIHGKARTDGIEGYACACRFNIDPAAPDEPVGAECDYHEELRSRLAEAERNLPCGHHHSLDDSYGGCVLCTTVKSHEALETELAAAEALLTLCDCFVKICADEGLRSAQLAASRIAAFFRRPGACPRCGGAGVNYSPAYFGGRATCLLCGGRSPRE